MLVRRDADGADADLVPDGFNVRTKVHEYGGGAWLLDGEVAFCSEFADQRLYRLEPGRKPVPITPDSEPRGSLRYADGRMIAPGGPIVCVRESHRGAEVVNELVAVPGDGSAPRVLASGRDFYSNPRPSPDGRLLAWLEWDHPRCPGTEPSFGSPSSAPPASSARRGWSPAGTAESIWQPEWSPDGRLHFVSDRSGWWNLYRRDRRARSSPSEAEYGYPAVALRRLDIRVHDRRTGRSASACRKAASSSAGSPTGAPSRSTSPTPPSAFPTCGSAARPRVFIAASPETEPAVIVLDLGSDATEVLRRASEREPSRATRRPRGRSSSRPTAARPLTASSTRPRTPSSKRPRASGRR